MAVNYATKYSSVVDEKFTAESRTAQAINQNYDWLGVETVVVYSIPTSALNDYQRSGVNRYGTPEELGDNKQEMTLTQDRSFTFIIDRANYDDTMMTKEAGKALSRQISERVVPEIDKYRLQKMVANAGTTGTPATPSKTNAYATFLAGTEALGNANVPATNRIAYVSYAFYNLLKQDSSFIKSGDAGQDITVKGTVGFVDGVAIVPVPATELPENVYLIMTHPSATVSPVKLTEYQIHENPPGISGWLVEGRVRYDAFVLNNKKNAIYVQASA